jgi:hypothetical protein
MGGGIFAARNLLPLSFRHNTADIVLLRGNFAARHVRRIHGANLNSLRAGRHVFATGHHRVRVIGSSGGFRNLGTRCSRRRVFRRCQPGRNQVGIVIWGGGADNFISRGAWWEHRTMGSRREGYRGQGDRAKRDKNVRFHFFFLLGHRFIAEPSYPGIHRCRRNHANNRIKKFRVVFQVSV